MRRRSRLTELDVAFITMTVALIAGIVIALVYTNAQELAHERANGCIVGYTCE